jgi:iron complex outermembrane receptor protein
MKKILKHPSLFTLSPLALAVLTDLSWAQERQVIEEVQVTARRVTESLQEVPVAISTIGGEALEVKQALDLGALEGIAPNVTFGRHGTFPNSAQITIRGMTSMDIERTFDPSVGVQVDGVSLATNTNQMLDLFDVESIEILRGPQGTLFGRNTIGGTVNVTRKQASFDGLSGDIQATLGNYGRTDGRAAINIPLTETLATRLSFFSSKSDGFVDNTFAGDERMGEEVLAARVNVVFEPTEDLSIAMDYDWLKDRSDTGYALNITDPAGYETGTGKAPYLWCTFGNPCNGKPNDLYKVAANEENLANIDRDAFRIQVNYRLGDSAEITYIGATAKQDELITLDWDGVAQALPVNPFYATQNRAQSERTTSHELRISGNLTDRIDGVAGIYFFSSDYSLTQIENFLQLPIDKDTGQKADSQAFFAQANYTLSEAWRITGGVRVTRDEKEFRTLSQFGGFDVRGLEEDWSETTYRLGTDYRINDDMMVYASFASGYKAGGFNGRAGSLAQAIAPYDPETVDTYEVGIKSDLLDGRVRLNLAAYRSNYDDLQLDVSVKTEGNDAPNTLVSNASSAISQGVEMELTALLTNSTTLRVTYGFLDTEYDDFVANLFGETDATGELLLVDYSGNDLRRSPRHQAMVSLNQEFEFKMGRLVAEANYRWTDNQHMTVDNDPYLEQDALGLLDLNLMYFSPNEQWRVALFVHNATDEEELGYMFRASNLWQFGTAATAPRTAGVTVGYSF